MVPAISPWAGIAVPLHAVAHPQAPAPAVHFQVTVPANVQASVPFSVLVEAETGSKHVATGYTGTVQISLGTADVGAILPTAYTFSASDHGEHRFQLTLAALGRQTIVACNTKTSSLTGSAATTVNPAPIESLATDLYAKLSSQPGNLAFSPFSIETALAMAYAGASGQTATEMANVLHLGPDTPATHAALAAMIQQVVADGNAAGSTLNTADALFGQTGYPFSPAYLQLLQGIYDAPLQNVDFQNASEQARATINSWVSQETQNKIPDLFPDGTINAQTRLVLANAIYFHGSWVNAFDPNNTNTGSFSVTPADTVQVSLMHQTSDFLYGNKNGVQTLEMPYVGGHLAMDILLPDQPDGIGTLSSELTAANLAQWTSDLSNDSVEVTLPKFQVNTSFSLNSVLSALGMPDAFNPKTANFSGMTTGPNSLYISQVVHQAYVNVDETGTEAAAATGIGVSTSAVAAFPPPPVVFDADHPFIYVIRDTSTNTILFMGRVSDPS